MENLQWFIKIGDESGAEVVWACCVACLAHLAALCFFMVQTEPTSTTSMDNLYDLTLDKLGNLALEVRIEQYSQFDVLTGVRIFQ